MIKAIFIDYTGTMVQEDEPYTRELIGYFIAHSKIKDPKEVLKIVWSKVKELEATSFGENFIKNDEKVEKILQYCVENCGLTGDIEYMHNLWRKIWVHAPLFDDVKPFFERMTLPIYVISNDDMCYLEESLKIKGIHPAGIISAEMVGACKPHQSIFEAALKEAGVKPEEAIHIGDSVVSDVQAAKELGIQAVYLSRNKKEQLDGVSVISSLNQLEI
ncbi:MAG: HAD family hydrolase [Lachnospiraceae bacterium]|nr:HAD family hydrolase [Lachnospiraceae bacterium]